MGCKATEKEIVTYKTSSPVRAGFEVTMTHVLFPFLRYSAVSIVQPRRHILSSVTDAIKVQSVIASLNKHTQRKVRR